MCAGPDLLHQRPFVPFLPVQDGQTKTGGMLPERAAYRRFFMASRLRPEGAPVIVGGAPADLLAGPFRREVRSRSVSGCSPLL